MEVGSIFDGVHIMYIGILRMRTFSFFTIALSVPPCE
jgi:hypothetical protein